MSSGKDPKEAITPVKSSPVRSVVGDIFTTSYYLMGNSYENVEGMLKLLESSQNSKRSKATNPKSSRTCLSPKKSLSKGNSLQPNKNNDARKDFESSIRRFQSSIDLTSFSKEKIPKNLKVDLLLKPNKSMLAEPDPNTPVCRLIGPIRVQTTESITYTEYGDSIVEERIELIGYGPRDKTKPQTRLKPQLKKVSSQTSLEQQPDTKQTILIADNYIRINRTTRLKRRRKPSGTTIDIPTKYEETRKFGSGGNGTKEMCSMSLNKRRRPMLTSRSETALSDMPIFNLIGPLDVTAKQEVINSDFSGYSISETIELRANNSKAQPIQRLVPFVQNKQEMSTDPKEDLPCQRNEKIFVGDNVITIDRIIRLKSLESTKRFSVVEHRDYVSDKTLNTAREKASESIMTAKSYGHSPPYYSLSSLKKRGSRCGRDSAKSPKRRIAEPMDSINDRKASHQHRRDEVLSNLQHAKHIQLSGQPTTALLNQRRKCEEKEEQSDDVYTAKPITNELLAQLKRPTSTVPQKSSRPSVHEKNQRQQSRHLTKVDRNIIAGGNVAAKRSESKQIKQELVSPKSSGHVKPERPECSDSSDRSGSLDDLSTARQYSTTYLTSSDEKVFQNGCASTFSRNSKERRTDTGISSSSVDPKFISQTTGTASNSNSKTKWLTNPAKGSYQKSKASRSQSRRTYREERRQARKFCSIRTDLLEHIPSMFDEQIKTSRSPGCSTERKLRNNSFEAVLSDSLRNYFGSNESEENPMFASLESVAKETATKGPSNRNESQKDLANTVHVPSFPNDVAKTASNRPRSSKQYAPIFKEWLRRHDLCSSNGVRAQVGKDTENVHIETADDQGMTVELDLNIRVRDRAGQILASNGGDSHIRCVTVNGRQFYEVKPRK
ncbi:hypothetical protein Tcan_18806 [Toxocara canis]|uniref:Uncharacterized protein n=1 Tax=Toxocara canis TaxID=6265 RepID=A0A0B2VWJ0_TOXCA|nr:hypothetical protein Tcan_18806 [Toxocara canis]